MIMTRVIHFVPRFASTRRLCRGLGSSAKRPLNVLFLGRESFSCETLKGLHEASDAWNSIEVVTPGDQMIGRYRQDLSVCKSPLKKLGHELGLKVHEIPPKPYNFKEWMPPASFLEDSQSSVIVTASFGRAIPMPALECFIPSHRLNVHPSLLPLFRGAAPIQRALMKGVESTGVSIARMQDIAYGFDTGPIWASSTMPIPPNSDYQSLEPVLAREGARLLATVLRNLVAGTASPTPQDDSKATKARLITANTASVRWSDWDASKIDRYYRAFGHQRALQTTLLSGKSLKLLSVAPRSADSVSDARAAQEGYKRQLAVLSHPGDASYDPTSKVVVIRCANGTYIDVHELQAEHRSALNAWDWWNGIKSKSLVDGVLKLGSFSGSSL